MNLVTTRTSTPHFVNPQHPILEPLVAIRGLHLRFRSNLGNQKPVRFPNNNTGNQMRYSRRVTQNMSKYVGKALSSSPWLLDNQSCACSNVSSGSLHRNRKLYSIPCKLLDLVHFFYMSCMS